MRGIELAVAETGADIAEGDGRREVRIGTHRVCEVGDHMIEMGATEFDRLITLVALMRERHTERLATCGEQGLEYLVGKGVCCEDGTAVFTDTDICTLGDEDFTHKLAVAALSQEQARSVAADSELYREWTGALLGTRPPAFRSAMAAHSARLIREYIRDAREGMLKEFGATTAQLRPAVSGHHETIRK